MDTGIGINIKISPNAMLLKLPTRKQGTRTPVITAVPESGVSRDGVLSERHAERLERSDVPETLKSAGSGDMAFVSPKIGSRL
jgi:hypothetical protein